MHSRLKFILPVVLLFIFVSTDNADAQLFGKLIKNRRATEETSVPAFMKYPRQKINPAEISFKEVTGLTLESFTSDTYLSFEGDAVPVIYLQPLTKEQLATLANTPRKTYGSVFGIYEEPVELQEEERLADGTSDMDENDNSPFTDHSDFEAVYRRFAGNDRINPYGITLSKMRDTVVIPVTGYVAPVKMYVTSEFGPRWGRRHEGTDLKVYKGDTIRSAWDGVVRIKRSDPRGYGRFVVIRHNNGLETLYGHMSKQLVAEGDSIRAGEAVGLGGRTGRSTGYHLHLEVRYLGNPINPRDVIDFTNHVTTTDTLVLTRENFKYQTIKIKRSRSRGRSGGSSTITVRKGDTLGAIARRNGTTVARIKSLNGLRSNNIRAGQKLKVK
ncbi:MAG: peptidoglycan DD-metalloendopeptidase family protein [Candidatus Egerieousia sp.]